MFSAPRPLSNFADFFDENGDPDVTVYVESDNEAVLVTKGSTGLLVCKLTTHKVEKREDMLLYKFSALVKLQDSY